MAQKKNNSKELEQIGKMFKAYIKYRRTGTPTYRKIYEEIVPPEIQKIIEETDLYFKKTLRSKLD